MTSWKGLSDVTRYPLAVVAPSLGTPSETFIQRHMIDLLPGRTALAVREVVAPKLAGDAPLLEIGRSRGKLRWAFDGTGYAVGLSSLSPVQRSLGRFLERNGVEVVLSEYLDQSLKWLPVARHYGIRFFAHAHGYDVSKSLRDPDIRVSYLRLAEADGIITMSRYSRDRLVEIGLPANKIHVVPYGIDVPRVLPERATGPHVRCLAVGRMVPKKAPLSTLEAFRLAAQEFPGLRLDYVGDGPLFEQAAEFVRGHGLEQRVTLHGVQPNATVLRLMKESGIFLQHSVTAPVTGDQEGLPVAILEAMAYGLPVVSTRHAGIPESVVEGETGLLNDEGDVPTMAANLLLLARDPELRERMGRDGWQRVRDQFSWEHERNALLELMGLSSGHAGGLERL